MPNSAIGSSRVERFLATLEKYVGATIWQGAPVFVAQDAPFRLEPCMDDAAVFQEALDSGKAVKRVLTVQSLGKPDTSIEIIAAKSHYEQGMVVYMFKCSTDHDLKLLLPSKQIPEAAKQHCKGGANFAVQGEWKFERRLLDNFNADDIRLAVNSKKAVEDIKAQGFHVFSVQYTTTVKEGGTGHVPGA